MKKLVCIFPGIGYGVESPLLYFADFLFETNGFVRVHINYGDFLNDKTLNLEQRLNNLRHYELEQLKNIDFSDFSEVVFISKSIGAVEAGWIANELKITVKQIFLTPIKESLDFCDSNSKVIIGTNDNCYLIYREYCVENNIPLLIITDGNHSLEIENEPYKSIDVLKQVMDYIL
jgi:hypothetical protein